MDYNRSDMLPLKGEIRCPITEDLLNLSLLKSALFIILLCRYLFFKTSLIICACVAILYFHTLSILLHFLNTIILDDTRSLELF